MAEIDMRAEFEKLSAQGKIHAKHIEPLVVLTASGHCQHRSWGFGKITTIDTVFARFVIDFKNKPGHQMDLAFAAEALRPIPPEHILARKHNNLDELRQMAALNHLELIKLVINSYQGKATLEQIQQILVPEIIRDDWKKWWEAARSEMKKDGHFIIPVKKTEPILYQEKMVSLQDRLMEEFRAARGLKARVLVATEICKCLPDIPDRQTLAVEAVKSLNSEVINYQRTQPATALEALFVRDDLRAGAAIGPVENEITDATIWAQPEADLAAVLAQTPASKHRRMLQSFKATNPDTWPEAVLGALNLAPTKLVAEMAHLLIGENKVDELKELLARLINQHQASSEMLLWLAKERSDAFADILGPEVFRAMLTAMERDQFNEKRSNRLGDYVVSDQDLLVELIGSADIEVIKDLTRALQLSPAFDDMDKRSLLARVVKSYPTMQALISGDQTKQDSSLIVSWGSLERRRHEYQDLVQKKIPANSKEIAIARSHGDLRENHEYKAAKEMQKLLMRRKAELEDGLNRARGTDFSEAHTEVVMIGTRVRLQEVTSQHEEAYAIMGAWDTDLEKAVISYLSPIAQALMGRKPGEEVEFEMDGHTRHFRLIGIEKVASAQPHPASEPAPSAPPPPAVDDAPPVPEGPAETKAEATDVAVDDQAPLGIPMPAEPPAEQPGDEPAPPLATAPTQPAERQPESPA